MALESPKNWWKPLHKEEKIWMFLILIWAGVMFAMMPLGHLKKQNAPYETYRTTEEEFLTVWTSFVEKYAVKDAKGQVVEEGGKTVVEPPEGDIFLLAKTWSFEPVLKLKKGKTYRMHMSSTDLQHGLSLQPINLNLQILPKYDYVATITPNATGVYPIVCNEFCFFAGVKQGHDTMVGKIYVE